MSDYPEHEKLREIVDVSNKMGELLDIGFPRMHLDIYERTVGDCECTPCRQRKGKSSIWHTDEEKATIVEGRVQLERWWPTRRSVQSILAEWFGIDQKKLDEEKEAMLEAIRAVNA